MYGDVRIAVQVGMKKRLKGWQYHLEEHMLKPPCTKHRHTQQQSQQSKQWERKGMNQRACRKRLGKTAHETHFIRHVKDA